MSFTWYKNQSSAESCNFGTLAVAWPLLDRMNVARIINQHLPADLQAEFDHGIAAAPWNDFRSLFDEQSDCWIVVEYLVADSFERAVVDDRQHAIRPVVQYHEAFDAKSDLDNNCVHSMRRDDDDDDCNYAQ